jgi:hypothetical protein
MGVKEDIESVLRTMEEAVQTHLNEERSRIQKLSDNILESTENISRVSEKNGTLLSEITDATKELNDYKPMEIFNDLYTRGNAEANLGNAHPEPDGLEARMAANANPAADSGAASGLDVNSLTAIPADVKAKTERSRKRIGPKSSIDSIMASSYPAAAKASSPDAAAAKAAAEAVAKRDRERSSQIRKLENERDILASQGKKDSTEYKAKNSQILVLRTMMNTGGGRKQTRRRKCHSFRRK